MENNFKISDIYDVIPKKIMKSLFQNYQLNLTEGLHGLSHWSRVLENGLILSEYNGANKKIIIAFAFFHNCLRNNEEHDPEEGQKGGNLLKYYEEDLNMTEEEINLAFEACNDFQHVLFNEDKNIAVCWDAERLDLMRSGIYPDKEKLHTEAAKNAGIITWAVKRGMNQSISDWANELLEDINSDC